MINLFFIFISALLLSLILHPVAIKISRTINFLDNPQRDRIHKNPTPVLGGVAICLSMLFVILAAKLLGYYQWSRISNGLLVGGGLIALVGFIDDRFGMNPGIKLTGQFIAAALFVIFTEFSIGIFHPLVDFCILVLGLVAMMNAFNILDNMDGVTGGMSFAIGLSFLAVAVLSDDINTAILLAAILGAIGGFLRYNLPRAKIFLGDCGAMFLGFIFGAFAIIYLINNRSYYLYTTPFLILSYPIFDIALVSLARMREKRSLSVAAPDSSPYRFVRWIFSTKNAFLAVFFINILMGAFGVTTFILKANQFSVILIFIAGVFLSVLGVHLYRNILYFIERTVFFLIDMISVNFALFILYSLKYNWNLFSFEIYIPFTEMLAPAVWISLFWVLFFSVMGVYEIRPNRCFFDYIKTIIRVVVFGSMAFLVVELLLEGKIEVSPIPLMFYAIILIISNSIFKYIAFLYARWLTNRTFKRPRVALLIKDVNENLGELLDIIRRRFTLLGYIGSPVPDLEYDNMQYLGEPESLNNLIREYKLEKIVLVWPEDNYDNYMHIMKSQYYLENEFLVMGTPPPVFTGFRMYRLYRSGLVKVSAELIRTWEWIVKRFMDFFLGTVILFVTIPVFLTQWIQAKINKHPMLVSKTISGRDAKRVTVKVFYNKNGNTGCNGRIKLGLPALLAVLKGNLSLVGKVPLSLEKANEDTDKFKGFWRRDSIKPGILGRAHFSDDESYFYEELKYMGNMSILNDIYLILVGSIKRLFLTGKKENVRSEIN